MSDFFLIIQGFLSPGSQQKILSATGKKDITADCRLLFFDYSEFDVPVGELFSTLTNKESGESYKINGELKFITQNQGRQLDWIPKGHKTICEVCFDKESLDIIISKIPFVDSWTILPVRYVLSGDVAK